MITPIRDSALERNVFVNNTFDIDVLNETYRQLLCENFFKLHDLQKSSLGIKIFKLHLSDFRKDLRLPSNSDINKCRGKYAIELDYEFIKPSIKLAYYNKPIFNKVIGIKNVCSNSKLYKNNVMVFINGMLCTNVVLFPDNSHTYVILDYNVIKIENESNVTDPEIVVAFVPNYKMGELTISQSNLENLKGELELSKFDNPIDITSKSLLFCSLDSDISFKDFINFKLNNNKITIPIPTSFNGTKRNICYITFNDNAMSNNITLDSTKCVRLTKSCPVPLDSILSFAVLDNGRSKNMNNVNNMRVYYPDVYRNITDYKLNCFILFNENIVTAKYSNDLELYYKFKENLLDKYSNDDMLSIVTDYEPLAIDYSIPDYEDSLYIPSVLSYKINTMQSYIDQDPNILTKYLSLKTLSSNKFLMSIRKQNMENRERENTYNDGVIDGNVAFIETHYLFPLPKSLLDLDIHDVRIFIDGKIIYNDNYILKKSNDMILIYVPKRLLPRRAIMEIERFFKFNFNTLVEFDESRNFIDIDFTNISTRPCAHDILLVDAETNKFISTNDYRIIAYNSSLQGYLTISPVSYKEIPYQFKVIMDNPDYYDKHIMIMVNNQSHMTKLVYDSAIPVYENIPIYNYDNTRDTFRVFKNGRLLPQFAYDVYIGDELNYTGYINLKTLVKANDVIIIDKIPVTYENVLYIDKIDNSRGFVDLHNKIDKPINLKWYDIYLDGIRLNTSNVFLISPTKMIIYGVNGLSHLYLCEKNRDDEVLRLQMDYDLTIIDKLIDQDPDFKQELLDQYPDIDDIIDDLLDDLIDDFDDFLEFFYTKIKYTFINPNIHQIPDDLKNLYVQIDDNAVLNLDANGDTTAKIIYTINPNEMGGNII